uniref:Pleckstrin homology and FYVE domain containing 1 n=1 Tax=Astyanax mexicanus TaxID=7994 RepID=W5LRY2_ASTMX
MADQPELTVENRERIQAVASSFGPSGRSLMEPGRVLVGEGRLIKLCKRRPQPRSFFLFNDILVYGSIVMGGRWNKKQQIIRLEEVEQEDLEDSAQMCNQWLLKTPRKSFYVAAASAEEKQAWMEHIENCRNLKLQSLGRPVNVQPVFAATWIPDHASAICMRCSSRFTVTHRRHHCRCCGFIVCNSCSKARVVLKNISNKPVRVCGLCKTGLENKDKMKTPSKQQNYRKQKEHDWKTNSLEDTPEYEASSGEESEEQDDDSKPTMWFNDSEYCYLNPEHANPPQS